jgi:hypothetical protein
MNDPARDPPRRRRAVDAAAAFQIGRSTRRVEVDQFDAVAVGVFDEGDMRRPMLHGAGPARNLCALGFEGLAHFIDVAHAKREMTKAGPDFVAVGLVSIEGQLDNRVVRLRPVADEGQRELTLGKILAAQQIHAEKRCVELDRGVEVFDANHPVHHAKVCGDAHTWFSLTFENCALSRAAVECRMLSGGRVG